MADARPITFYGTPVLHRRCADVTVFDQALGALIDDMFASMYAASGVGLAANQIGVDAQIFVYDCPDADDVRQKGHVINPVITSLSAELDDGTEGCLSVPGPRASVPRASVATVTGVDLAGEPITVTGTGYFARCLQHETDHLNGTLYVDLLPGAQRDDLLREAGLTPPS
ncbi:peptide deformylase 2 [Actinoplanes philippinensis]|uniref:Peptide deformylase n=1 Tax=Actinoplanes philippinensis TaxID=35752 RepID=A0A1I2I266_9ACTN|nr:peptide deformylase [Actinoplanes philippinensis]GIE78766.1 peptide deformylase 2 [Actinoplanes philippinensis]SFF35730.1 peptide deformylase [Actinoplanes philippinensis]